jgi:hypothetical protein
MTTPPHVVQTVADLQERLSALDVERGRLAAAIETLSSLNGNGNVPQLVKRSASSTKTERRPAASASRRRTFDADALVALVRGRPYSARELRSALKTSRDTLQRVLAQLVRDRRIVRTGQTKAIKYSAPPADRPDGP